MIKTKEQQEFLKYFKEVKGNTKEKLRNEIKPIINEYFYDFSIPKELKVYINEMNDILDNIISAIDNDSDVNKYVEELSYRISDFHSVIELVHENPVIQKNYIIALLWMIETHSIKHKRPKLIELHPYKTTIKIGTNKIEIWSYELYIAGIHVVSFIDDDTWYIVEQFDRVLTGGSACPMLFTNKLEDIFIPS